MKATARDFASKATAAKGGFRICFLCGPDEAGASAAVAKVIAALPNAGERVYLNGQDLKGDPSRLVDEARSTSLFGDARHLVARVSGEDAHDALAAFCEIADRGEANDAWPVFVIASGATDKSRSAKLLLTRPDALVALFYPPDLKSMAADVGVMLGAAGLRYGGDLAERIARAAGLDVRLAQSEVDKLALYLNASPQDTRTADVTAWDAIGAKTDEDGFMPLVNVVLSGEARKLPGELARMRDVSINPVALTLALERRAAQLMSLAGQLRPGDNIARLLESNHVFFKDRPDIEKQLRRWNGPQMERLVERISALHRNLLTNSQTAELLLSQELTRIASAGTRR